MTQIMFSGTIIHSVWTDKNLPITFAIIDDVFFYQKTDVVGNKYWVKLLGSLKEEIYTQYLMSIYYFFYRYWNDNVVISNNVQKWLHKKLLGHVEVQGEHDSKNRLIKLVELIDNRLDK